MVAVKMGELGNLGKCQIRREANGNMSQANIHREKVRNQIFQPQIKPCLPNSHRTILLIAVPI